MSTAKPISLLRIEYENAAEAYLRSLPLEHFMEAIGQSTQRKITVASFEIIHLRRREIQLYSELLVQYPKSRPPRIRQVVPDNMVLVWKEPLKLNGSFDVPFHPTGPFWVMEYVSKHNKRKDYEDSFRKYERDLKVPYYLVFYPDGQEMTLYRHNGKKYVTVKPNPIGRYPVPELDVEVKILDGWVRYWYQGELILLPADIQRELDQVKQERDQANQQRDQANQQRDQMMVQLEEERQARILLEQQVAELRAKMETPSGTTKRKPRNGG